MARSSINNAPAAADAAFHPEAESPVPAESRRMRDARVPRSHARKSNPCVVWRAAGTLIAARMRATASNSATAAVKSPAGCSVRRSMDGKHWPERLEPPERHGHLCDVSIRTPCPPLRCSCRFGNGRRRRCGCRWCRWRRSCAPLGRRCHCGWCNSPRWNQRLPLRLVQHQLPLVHHQRLLVQHQPLLVQHQARRSACLARGRRSLSGMATAYTDRSPLDCGPGSRCARRPGFDGRAHLIPRGARLAPA